MEKEYIQVSHTQVVMAFVATCIEATSRLLGVSYKTVYDRIKRVGLIEDYILPCYETLHSESRENIALNIADCLTKWEERNEHNKSFSR